MRDPAYSDRVRKDFDRLALLSEESGWEHNSHYHPFLLRQLRGMQYSGGDESTMNAKQILGLFTRVRGRRNLGSSWLQSPSITPRSRAHRTASALSGPDLPPR
jgi:hypothetical protein